MTSTRTRPKPSAGEPAETKHRRAVPIRNEAGEISGYLMNATGAQWLLVERRAMAGIGLKETRRER
jgi:hypothetical protein